jgi:probable F420-dependent oxidoreductase
VRGVPGSGDPRLSISLPSVSATNPGGWSHVIEAAKALDEAGVDRLVVSDHVAFGERLEEYARPEIGGVEGGQQPTGPDGHWLEPLSVLAAVSSVTSHARLATVILLAALRRPVVLAKTVATLDVLSAGRLDLGVGVGWQREEYEAAGLDFDHRGRLLDHTLAVCQALWRQRRADYSSDDLTFRAIHQMPKPVQPGGVPIWVSGSVNPPVVRRLVRFGTGWIPWGRSQRDVVSGIREMRDAVAAAGRDPYEVKVLSRLSLAIRTDGLPDAERTMAPVDGLAQAGVTDFRMRVPLPRDRGATQDLLYGLVSEFRNRRR